MKKAFVTGITGQDGSYLAELLLAKGYQVHGLIRRASTFNTGRIEHLYKDPHTRGVRLLLHYGDLTDSGQLTNLVYNIRPDEIYHLAAQSHVRVSFDMPEFTGEVTALGTTRILEAIRLSGIKTKFYYASSSEMFGNAPAPQNEDSPFYPKSPYAVAKVYGYWMVNNYRQGYNLFTTNGILFNHESPRRGETFVSRKISRAVAHILAKKQDFLYLGNLTAKRDWGYAPEYVEAIYSILQQDQPDDYVLGTGQTHTVKEFAQAAFSYAGLDLNKYLKIDPRYFRPIEVEELIADISRAKLKLNWQPKINFDDLVKIMVDADLRKVGLKPVGDGDKILREKYAHRWWSID